MAETKAIQNKLSSVAQNRPTTHNSEVSQSRPSKNKVIPIELNDSVESAAVQTRPGSHEVSQSWPSKNKEKQDYEIEEVENKCPVRKERNQNGNYYKSLKIETNKFHSVADFPRFNPGRKPVKPSDTIALENLCIVEVDNEEDYIKIKEIIIRSDELKDGQMNIDGINCDGKGKIKIKCENAQSKTKAFELLERESYRNL